MKKKLLLSFAVFASAIAVNAQTKSVKAYRGFTFTTKESNTTCLCFGSGSCWLYAVFCIRIGSGFRGLLKIRTKMLNNHNIICHSLVTFTTFCLLSVTLTTIFFFQ